METVAKIIVGQARVGKFETLVSRYQAVLENPAENSLSNCLWLGPNRHATSRVRDVLASRAPRAVLDPKILTIAQFADRIISQSRRNVRPLSSLQKRRLLAEQIAVLHREHVFRHFEQVALTPGFLAHMAEMIADLKRRDIWAEAFKQQGRSQREREIAAIYSAYQRKLVVHQLYDAEGRFWAAREMLENEAFGGLQYDLVIVEGFSDFTSAQYDILRRLASYSREFWIALTTEANSNGQTREELFAKSNHTLNRLVRELDKVEIESRECRSGSPRDALQHLERHLFSESSPPESIEGATQIHVIEGLSHHAEIRQIAWKIKRLLVEERTPPGEILVVFPHLSEVAGRSGEVFRDFGIPYYLEHQSPLVTHPLVRTLLDLLRLLQEDWPFRRLLALTGNRLVQFFDAEEASGRTALEHCLRTAQISRGRQALLNQLRRWAEAPDRSEDQADQFALLASQACARLQKFGDLLDRLPEQATLPEWMDHLKALAGELGLLNGSTTGNCGAAWNLLRSGVRSLELADQWTEASRPLSLAECIETLEMVAREQRISSGYDDVGRVRILKPESARSVSAWHVFLGGLNEQALVSPESSRDVSSTVLGELSAEEPTPYQEAQLLFYTLVTRATKTLTLSYPAVDSKGQILPPSPMLEEVEHVLGPKGIARTVLADHAPGEQQPASRSGYRQSAVAQAVAGRAEALVNLVSLQGWETMGASLLSGLEAVASRADRKRFGPFEGICTGSRAQDSLARRFGPDHLWSPSQLESYATCPFRFFGEQLLGLQPVSELRLQNDPRRRGSLLHQVLAAIHLQVQQALESEAEEGAEAALLKRFQRALDEAIEASPLAGLEQSLREIERRELESLASQYVEQEDKYQKKKQWQSLDQPLRPAYFELRFGPAVHEEQSDAASNSQSFTLDLGSEEIQLTGQIDRIDVGQIGNVRVFNIIDYKTGGGSGYKFRPEAFDRRLQLPLYALVAEKLLLAEQEAKPLSTGYWHVKGNGYGGKNRALEMHAIAESQLQETAEWQELKPALMERIGQIVASLRRGEFPVFNRDSKCTQYCELRTVCRVAQVRSLDKQWEPTAEAECGIRNAEGPGESNSD